jgi:hypothetical protein
MREGAGPPARSLSIGGDHGPGGQIPAWSLLRGFVADDDGVALVVAGVDVAAGHRTAIGLGDRYPTIAGGGVATVASDSAGATGRGVADCEERDGGQTGDRCVYCIGTCTSIPSGNINGTACISRCPNPI